MHMITKFYRLQIFVGLFIASTLTQANPVACFTTNMGNFCIELFEAHTPVTTANFLSYVNSGAYTNGIFHRSVPGFVIQGGGFKIAQSATGSTLTSVNTLAPIINEYKISNTRGTVAMAKLGNDPNSATSQWFVNMADNSVNLNNQNGGFTVFGRIVFGGMVTFDAIEQLSIFNLGNSSLTSTPLTGYNGVEVLTGNFVRIQQATVTDTAGIFDEDILSLAVDIGSNTILEADLRLISTNPDYIFELNASSIQTLATKPASTATFSTSTGELHIPSVMLGASVAVQNVVMKLTDSDTYRFTLVSYE
jgi:peptidyl-prolyl cis-trans isomerase A (cyclophilin A)